MLSGRCNVSECRKKKQMWKKAKKMSSYPFNQPQTLPGTEGGSRHAQWGPCPQGTSTLAGVTWGHLRSGAALGLEACSYLEISTVPLLLILSLRGRRWKCCEEFLPLELLWVFNAPGMAGGLQPWVQGIFYLTG